MNNMSEIPNGPIECGVQNDDGSPEMQTVFDLRQWVRNHFLDLRESATVLKKNNEKNPTAERWIWVGSYEKPFAKLIADCRKYRTEYSEAKFIVRIGFMEHLGFFESTDIDEVLHDFLSKFNSVDRNDC